MELDLFSGFKKLNAIKYSSFVVKGAEYAKKKAELELLTNITLAYARFMLDRKNFQAARSDPQKTLSELEIIREKINVGRLSKYEIVHIRCTA